MVESACLEGDRSISRGIILQRVKDRTLWRMWWAPTFDSPLSKVWNPRGSRYGRCDLCDSTTDPSERGERSESN